MIKIIAICDTYAQLINTMQLRRELFSNEYFAVVLTNNSNNSQVISCKLSEENFFDEVVFWKTKGVIECISQTPIQKLKSVFPMIAGKLDNITGIRNNVFDRFIYYSIGPSTLTLFSFLYNNNKIIRCSRYEEGALSYGFLHNEDYLSKYPNKLVKLMGGIRHILRKKNITDVLDEFFCYYPELYKGRLKTVCIPKISMDSDLRNVLIRIFDVDISQLSYEQRYIFFAAMYDDEGVKELDLVKKIEQYVGKDNLLIKVHPRDNSGRFKDGGFNIDNNSLIPWEIIQLNYDFNNHVYLTLTSQSVLSISMISEKHPKVYFLFKLLDMSKSPNASVGIDTLYRLFESMEDKMSGFFIADTIEEISGRRDK